MAWKHSVSV